MSDAQAVAHVFAEIGKVYGRGRSWKQEDLLVGRKNRRGEFTANFLRRDWSKDPFARGGNSYLAFFPPGGGRPAAAKAREALKDPRATLPLFWAGEATAPAYDPDYQPLAFHGAYISGVRAAEDVLHYLGEARGDGVRFARYYKDRYPLKKVRPPAAPPIRRRVEGR